RRRGGSTSHWQHNDQRTGSPPSVLPGPYGHQPQGRHSRSRQRHRALAGLPVGPTRSRSPVLLRISTPLAGERALCEVAKTATLAAHHSHSVDCKAERVRPGKCGNDTPIVSSASWCRLKTVTRYGRRTSPRRRGTSRLTAQTSGVRCCALKTNPACPVFVATLRGY